MDKFVSGNASQMTLSHDGSPNTQHNVASNVTVTLNGATSKITDLKPGDAVALIGTDPVTTITASGAR